jgi:hypothetical protein
LFLIGQDAAKHASAFAPLAALGCEVASHSYAHDYRLSVRAPEVIDADLLAAEEALMPLAPDGKIQGFRAPGYNVSPALLEAVARRGYLYESSLLPSPAYFAARGAALAQYALRGKSSSSLLGDVRAFAGPLNPYRTSPEQPWKRIKSGMILELPIACAPFTRAPIIGTSWALLPNAARALLLPSALSRLRLFNFELHAIDFLDHSDAHVPAELALVQPDLKISVAHKMSVFGALFRRLAESAELTVLSKAAEAFQSA